MVGQLSTSIVHKMWKLRDFALSEIKPQAIFLRYATYCGISKMAAIDIGVTYGSKIETCSYFSENSVNLFVLSQGCQNWIVWCTSDAKFLSYIRL